MATTIQYTKGDATCPQGAGLKIIIHIVNNRGKWGKGFVLALSKRWKQPEQRYRQSFKDDPKPTLGIVQFVPVRNDIVVVNMFAQDGFVGGSRKVAVDYEALEWCLGKLVNFAKRNEASIHMPRIGCGLAGGRWEKVEPIIVRNLCDRDVDVTVYDF